jgi:L-alanine-DL-glutamate epimerase-like enolase superfamily enzyme
LTRLKVKDIERITLQVPFTPRCQPWNDLLVWGWQVVELIRITADGKDLVGYGETLPFYTHKQVSDEEISLVLGSNPLDHMADDRLGMGLQMALYDLVGKALDTPVNRLFNLPQVRDRCPIAWWNTKMPPEVLAEEAKEALSKGYLFHKFKARPWFDVYSQVEAVSAVTPNYYRLDLDWNDMLLNAGNAVPVLQQLDQYERIAIYEGPIPQQDIEGYRLIRQKVKHPIAIHFGDPPFPTCIRAEMCDGFVMGWSGISSTLAYGQMAGAFHKPFWLQMVGTGLITALAAHIGSVLPFAQWPMITCLNNYIDDLIVDPLHIEFGYIHVPDGPGLGVTVDEDALLRYRMPPPYVLPEPRRLMAFCLPGGRKMYFAHLEKQMWAQFLAGNFPVQERGANLEVYPDDGSAEWQAMYQRAEREPFYA